MKLIFFTTLALIYALSSRAEAYSFETVGAGCFPADDVIQAGSVLVTAGTVKNASGDTNTIVLYCILPTNIATPSAVTLEFADGNTSSSNFVKAQYMRMSKSLGTITSIATASSENSCETGSCEDGNTHYTTTTFSDTYDLSNYLFFVRVTIQRISTSDVATFYGVTVN